VDAIIFDLNGTLVDSEGAHWLAYRDVLAGFAIDFDFEEFNDDWTRRGRDLAYTLRKHDREDLVARIPEVKREKDAVFRATMTERVPAMPGATAVIPALAREFALGLDSTSAREDILLLLKHLSIDRFFTALSSGEMAWDVEKWGPNTKATRFLWLAEQLGCRPSRCLVVGDAEKDVIAAKKSGMAVAIVPTESTKDNDFSGADRVLASLNDLTVQVAREILAAASAL
jgi:beta-phosphoglucomutase